MHDHQPGDDTDHAVRFLSVPAAIPTPPCTRDLPGRGVVATPGRVSTSRKLFRSKGLNLSHRCHILDKYQAPARSGDRRRPDRRREQDFGAAAPGGLGGARFDPRNGGGGGGPGGRCRSCGVRELMADGSWQPSREHRPHTPTRYRHPRRQTSETGRPIGGGSTG